MIPGLKPIWTRTYFNKHPTWGSGSKSARVNLVSSSQVMCRNDSLRSTMLHCCTSFICSFGEDSCAEHWEFHRMQFLESAVQIVNSHSIPKHFNVNMSSVSLQVSLFSLAWMNLFRLNRNLCCLWRVWIVWCGCAGRWPATASKGTVSWWRGNIWLYPS